MTMTSLTEKDQLIDSTASQIYELLKKRTDIRNQLLQVYEKLPDKNTEPPEKETLTLGYTIRSTILTGLIASPAFTINYLNKYITPEKYQNVVDKISLGTAGLIGAIGGFKVAKQGMKSVYDWFRYESIRKEIKRLEDKLSEITRSINNIKRQKDFDLYDVLNIHDYEKLYKVFIEFYKNNNDIITEDGINTFISAHPDILPKSKLSDPLFRAYGSYEHNIKYILDTFRNMRNKLILSVAYPDSSSSGDSWFSWNSSGEMVMGIMLIPWYILGAAINEYGKKDNIQRQSSYQKYKQLNEKEYKKYTEIDEADAIINQLKTIMLETVNEQ